MRITKQTLTQLTAPGTTAWVEMGRLKPASADLEVIVAAINTNVVVKVEYSEDGSAVAASSLSETITANGTYNIPLSVRYRLVRLNFVSEAGGTDATVDSSVAQHTN